MTERHARPGSLLPAGGASMTLLLVLAGGAWLLSARLASADMRQGVLTTVAAPIISASGQMGDAGSMAMSTPKPDPMTMSMSMGLDVFVGSWAVMMAAMMLPSLLPAARTVTSPIHPASRALGAVALFAAGYLLVWSAAGIIAYAVVQALLAWLPAGNPTAIRGGAVLLLAAGIYQLTPLKHACLGHCRTARADMAAQGFSPTLVHASRKGLAQGLYCLGSSWPLMLVLLLLGMMNLAWMGIVAALIFVEKVVPNGQTAGKAVGLALVGLGILLVATAHPLPALLGLAAGPL